MTAIPDRDLHVARLRDFGPLHVPDPAFGDLRLAVFPFQHNGRNVILPEGFQRWHDTLAAMMRDVPVQRGATQAFVTIDSKFFTTPGFLRREGVHMDGNFCADPSFAPKASWGGDPGKTWGAGLRAVGSTEQPDNSHVEIGFALPYDDLIVPIGKYVSGSLGGTLVASSYEGCQAWPGTYRGEVGDGGDWTSMTDQLGTGIQLGAHRLWFLTSNCPHETLVIPQGVRRTFVRVTLPHNYDNTALLG